MPENKATGILSHTISGMDERHLAERLRTVHHFRNLGITDLLKIVSSGRVRRFHAEEFIFHEGEPCAGMHVLIQGQVEIQKTGPQGKTGILSTIEPVIMFNEVAVLDGGPNPFTAQATKDCTIWQVSYDSFQNLLERYPQIGLGLLRVLARRNRQMLAHYEDVSFRSVLARTAKLLLELSGNGAMKIKRSEYPISNMAARIASVPEIISRSLNTFKSQGAIQYDRSEIIVTNPDMLAEIAQVTTTYIS
ncbi:MAG: Crp/Fnr family transcriptional regulator [Anaerolineales bacterium]